MKSIRVGEDKESRVQEKKLGVNWSDNEENENES